MDFSILPEGTRLSGFVSAGLNQPPRDCGHCVHYKSDHCHHPVVMDDCEVPGECGKPKPVHDEDCCNFFQSPGKTLIFGLRHGMTQANEQGLHRGWAEIPLDPEGRTEAKEAGNWLRDMGIQRIYSSDLGRARETAKIVGDMLGLTPIMDFRLRPINKGDFQGEKKDETKEAFDWYVRNPSEKIPGGESIDEFDERYDEALQAYLCEAKEAGPILLVTHNSNCIGGKRLLTGKGDEADKEIVAPGGVFRIDSKGGKLTFNVPFKAGGAGASGS